MEYGYIRVSTKEQNEQRQLIAMQEFGITGKQIYMDKQKGLCTFCGGRFKLFQRICSVCGRPKNY